MRKHIRKTLATAAAAGIGLTMMAGLGAQSASAHSGYHYTTTTTLSSCQAGLSAAYQQYADSSHVISQYEACHATSHGNYYGQFHYRDAGPGDPV